LSPSATQVRLGWCESHHSPAGIVQLADVHTSPSGRGRVVTVRGTIADGAEAGATATSQLEVGRVAHDDDGTRLDPEVKQQVAQTRFGY